ncbi:conserved exported hypothetical protein [Verrucomicrobia bacterium]|nr:conserved exported hypothetical protein [Verrucomicrobiota bacterium]
MNRSILIVICDFLLVSLLAFSSADVNNIADPNAPRSFKLDASSNAAENSKDLAAVMKLALEDEQQRRELLLSELTKTRDAVTEKEQQVQTIGAQLQSREQQAQQLQEQQARLQQQFAAAQTNIQLLDRQLANRSTEAQLSQDKLASLQAEMRKRVDEAAAAQQQLAQLAKSNELALVEKQRLSGQLQVAEVERRSALAEAARMNEEVKVEREEKAKLAEGVKALATKSSQLAEEIRQNTPLAPNAIFNDFVSNRVEASFWAVRSGFLGGEASKHKETQTVLVGDGTNTYALCHVQDTPLSLWTPGADWDGLTGALARNGSSVPIHSLSFSLQDPRVVLMPVSASDVRQLGSKPYRLSSDPWKFQDAVLVGAEESYYGECKFEMDLTTPDYVKLDHSLFKGLFGKFNPSRGDLVFSKTGELLGVMANSTYCLKVQNFSTAATFQFGQDVRQQHTGAALSRLYSLVFGLPYKLQ